MTNTRTFEQVLIDIRERDIKIIINKLISGVELSAQVYPALIGIKINSVHPDRAPHHPPPPSEEPVSDN